jgi:hypothetical protein
MEASYSSLKHPEINGRRHTLAPNPHCVSAKCDESILRGGNHDVVFALLANGATNENGTATPVPFETLIDTPGLRELFFS